MIIDINAAVEFTGISLRSLRQHVADKTIPHFYMTARCRLLRFDTNELDQWIAATRKRTGVSLDQSLANMRAVKAAPKRPIQPVKVDKIKLCDEIIPNRIGRPALRGIPVQVLR